MFSDESLHYGSDHAYCMYNVATKKYLASHQLQDTTNVTLTVGNSYLLS